MSMFDMPHHVRLGDALMPPGEHEWKIVRHVSFLPIGYCYRFTFTDDTQLTQYRFHPVWVSWGGPPWNGTTYDEQWKELTKWPT